MLTSEHIIREAKQDALLDLISDFGIYAILISGKEKMILEEDCIIFAYYNNIGLYYIPKSLGKTDVIPKTERAIFVPYHAIQAIAFNDKPRT